MTISAPVCLPTGKEGLDKPVVLCLESCKAELRWERDIVGTERVKPNWGCPANEDLTSAELTLAETPVGSR